MTALAETLPHGADSASQRPQLLTLSLVLACYNEGPTLRESLRDIVAVLEATRFSYELIFVDDASRDRTPELIQSLCQEYAARLPIRTIFHQQNTGRGGAVRDGFLAARGEIVGYLDVDLEVPAHYLVSCVMAIQQGCDVAVGKRVYTFAWRSLDRYFMSKGYAWLVRRALRLHGLTDTEAGYKFFRRDKVLPLLAQCQETGWFWDTEIMALAHQAGLSINEIPCLLVRRFDKVSSVRPLRDSADYFMKLVRFRMNGSIHPRPRA